jgi:hypothetical protein
MVVARSVKNQGIRLQRQAAKTGRALNSHGEGGLSFILHRDSFAVFA